MADTEQQAKTVVDLVTMIGVLLHSHPREVQGAVVADLLSMWLAGHHPALREEALMMHIEFVRALIPPNEARMFEAHGGKPEGWDKQ